MKLTETEKTRIKAYMEKCAENMKKAGGREKDIISAYYHNEANAMNAVLKETRPSLTGWWNTEEEILFSEKVIKCRKCGKTIKEVSSMVSIDLEEWNCDVCIGNWEDYGYHPSGDSEPSDEDLTIRLKDCTIL